MTANLLKAALIAALFASAAAFADNSVQVTVVDGQQQAKFNIGDSKCTLTNDVVVCAPVILAAN
jgi:hydrogenase maturation factor